MRFPSLGKTVILPFQGLDEKEEKMPKTKSCALMDTSAIYCCDYLDHLNILPAPCNDPISIEPFLLFTGAGKPDDAGRPAL